MTIAERAKKERKAQRDNEKRTKLENRKNRGRAFTTVLSSFMKKTKITIPVMVLILMSIFTISAAAAMINTVSTVKNSTKMTPFVDTFGTSMRLDNHDGQMVLNSKNLMAYGHDDLTDPKNHYIVQGDWYDKESGGGNSSVYLTYPITIKNGNGTITETHYFNSTDFSNNSDGAAGKFWISSNFSQTYWYNATTFPSNPSSIFKYYDDRHFSGKSDNGAVLYVSNNVPFHLTAADSNGHRQLWCGSVCVMKATTEPTVDCYYDHNDKKDADWGWVETSKAWGKDGIIEGKNTIYYVGMDASGNFIVASGS
jgi:hypothetical protein